MHRLLAPLKALVRPRPSVATASRFGAIDAQQRERIECALREHYFAGRSNQYLESEAGQVDLHNHLEKRLQHDRFHVIPWLESVQSLAGRTVLEIGCGTGCSTVALAEQGAHVTAVDLDEPAMQVARTRCQEHQVEVEFHLANAVEVHERLAARTFDYVIFYAALEHMTHEERILAIQRTWPMVAEQGHWCVVETPNRLWYFDHHTSLMPHYHWLPDDLARGYAKFSPRDSFRERFQDNDETALLEFLRQGRGVSYHEWELALETPAEQLDVVSGLATYHRGVNLLRQLKWPRSRELRFTSLLREVSPRHHVAFLQPSLDLAIKPHSEGAANL